MGVLVSDDSNKRRNYEDLKARLGLKKADLPPASSGGSDVEGDPIGQDPGDRTPPGGFTLGLERGGRELDSALIDVDKAASRMTSEGGAALRVKASFATRVLIFILLIVGAAVAFGFGYQVQKAQYDNVIADRQQADGEALLKAVEGSVVIGGSQPVTEAVDAFSALVEQTSQGWFCKTTGGTSEEGSCNCPEGTEFNPEVGCVNEQGLTTARVAVTDEVLAALAPDLKAIQEAAVAYVTNPAVIDLRNTLGKHVFNADALKLVIEYERILSELHWQASLIAQEDVVLGEFERVVSPDSVEVPSVVRSWRYAIRKVDDRPTGFLVKVSYVLDDEGKINLRQVPIEVPEGFRLPEGAPTHRWEVEVKYDNPALFGTEQEFVETDNLVEWDLKDEVAPLVQQSVSSHDRTYRTLLLKRLFDRVAALKATARRVATARISVLERLQALATSP
jgi:hypothetical protein